MVAAPLLADDESVTASGLVKGVQAEHLGLGTRQDHFASFAFEIENSALRSRWLVERRGKVCSCLFLSTDGVPFGFINDDFLCLVSAEDPVRYMVIRGIRVRITVKAQGADCSAYVELSKMNANEVHVDLGSLWECLLAGDGLAINALTRKVSSSLDQTAMSATLAYPRLGEKYPIECMEWSGIGNTLSIRNIRTFLPKISREREITTFSLPAVLECCRKPDLGIRTLVGKSGISSPKELIQCSINGKIIPPQAGDAAEFIEHCLAQFRRDLKEGPHFEDHPGRRLAGLILLRGFQRGLGAPLERDARIVAYANELLQGLQGPMALESLNGIQKALQATIDPIQLDRETWVLRNYGVEGSLLLYDRRWAAQRIEEQLDPAIADRVFRALERCICDTNAPTGSRTRALRILGECGVPRSVESSGFSDRIASVIEKSGSPKVKREWHAVRTLLGALSTSSKHSVEMLCNDIKDVDTAFEARFLSFEALLLVDGFERLARAFQRDFINEMLSGKDDVLTVPLLVRIYGAGSTEVGREMLLDRLSEPGFAAYYDEIVLCVLRMSRAGSPAMNRILALLQSTSLDENVSIDKRVRSAQLGNLTYGSAESCRPFIATALASSERKLKHVAYQIAIQKHCAGEFSGFALRDLRGSDKLISVAALWSLTESNVPPRDGDGRGIVEYATSGLSSTDAVLQVASIKTLTRMRKLGVRHPDGYLNAIGVALSDIRQFTTMTTIFENVHEMTDGEFPFRPPVAANAVGGGWWLENRRFFEDGLAWIKANASRFE